MGLEVKIPEEKNLNLSINPIFRLEPTKPRTGILESNGLLNNAEQLYKGKLLGPEAFQTFNGELYTSLATGEIVKLTAGGHVTFVTKIGQPCSKCNKKQFALILLCCQQSYKVLMSKSANYKCKALSVEQCRLIINNEILRYIIMFLFFMLRLQNLI